MTYVWREVCCSGRRNEAGHGSEHVADAEDGSRELRRDVHRVDEEGAVHSTVQRRADGQQRHRESRLRAVDEAERHEEDAGSELG